MPGTLLRRSLWICDYAIVNPLLLDEQVQEPSKERQLASRRPRLAVATPPPTATTALTMADAKKKLALTFGVAPDAIEITIRG
jgi:hypothetical protein